MAEAARTARAGGKFWNDFKVRERNGNDDHLRIAIAGLDGE
jgi:hypothetical protein